MVRSSDSPPTLRSVAIRVLGATAMVVALLSIATVPSRAQPVCMPHDDLSRNLFQRFTEAPVANAIANNGSLVELYATKDRSSWTLVMRRPQGTSCVLVAGAEWNYFPGFWREQMVEAPDRQGTP